jgi:hypothetical protein
MEIDMKDGKAVLNISGAFSGEELRDLLQRLCQQHAKLVPNSELKGSPLFAYIGSQVDFALYPLDSGRARFALLTPTFGWVGIDLDPLAVLRVVEALAKCAADIVEGNAAQRQVPNGPSSRH